MTVHGQLLQMLETVTVALDDDLRERLVFVGGCTTALFITDPITLEDVRTSDDVDLIVDLAAPQRGRGCKRFYVSAALPSPLRMPSSAACGFGALKVDFMPDDETILGFSNRWYAKGIETAVVQALTPEIDIRLLTPPLFLATKLEAYQGRGDDDPIGSRDLEDFLLIVDGREELLGEVQNADEDIKSFIAEVLRTFHGRYDFDNFLEGNISGPEGRVDVVRGRIEALAHCDGKG